MLARSQTICQVLFPPPPLRVRVGFAVAMLYSAWLLRDAIAFVRRNACGLASAVPVPARYQFTKLVSNLNSFPAGFGPGKRLHRLVAINELLCPPHIESDMPMDASRAVFEIPMLDVY